MKQIRKRLTYANVMSSIAVFLVLGGATAIAANQLGKNSVGSKQIKKNAVTTAKIKKNAVTTAKIKNGAVTGAKVNLGSLGTVPNASHATSADTAGSANTVGGSTLRKFFYATNSTASKTQILSLGGLTLTASCEGAEPQLIANTSVNHSLIHNGIILNTDAAAYNEDDDFETGNTFNVLIEGNDSIQGTFTYSTPGGTVVTATYQSETEGFDDPELDCVVSGNAIG